MNRFIATVVAGAMSVGMAYAGVTEDDLKNDQTITDQRSHAPFDPFLMAVSALSGMVRDDRDLQRRAALFDRALLLAPHDRRIRTMRDAGQLMLQTRPPEWQQPAKSGPEVR